MNSMFQIVTITKQEFFYLFLPQFIQFFDLQFLGLRYISD